MQDELETREGELTAMAELAANLVDEQAYNIAEVSTWLWELKTEVDADGEEVAEVKLIKNGMLRCFSATKAFAAGAAAIRSAPLALRCWACDSDGCSIFSSFDELRAHAEKCEAIKDEHGERGRNLVNCMEELMTQSGDDEEDSPRRRFDFDFRSSAGSSGSVPTPSSAGSKA